MLFNINRAYRLRARYELMLSLFAPGIKTTSNQHHVIWGIDAEFTPGRDLTPRLVQEHYTIPGFPSVVDSRTPMTDPLIELIPDTDYFGLHGRAVSQDLVLPQSLEAWVNSALACDDLVSKRLVRAAYWLNHAGQVFRLSLSASLVAAIQAIEVLLPAVKGEVCPTCKREVAPGPTRKFKDFLQQYAPTNDSEERKARDLLYRQRSRLIHGHELLGTDGDYNFGWTNPAHAFDRMTLDGAVRLARIATINWFVAHASSTIRSTGA
jgi:hypothetical protein